MLHRGPLWNIRTARWGSARLPLLVALVGGIAVGLGVFTFGYGKGAAYLSNDPAACANCHIMQEHYDTWQAATHARVATCNSCHLPHHPVGKWITKADNGFFHSLAFTTGSFPEPLRIKPRNRRVTQGACLDCHDQLADALRPAHVGGDMLPCVHCHAQVGHAGRAGGVSSRDDDPGARPAEQPAPSTP